MESFWTAIAIWTPYEELKQRKNLNNLLMNNTITLSESTYSLAQFAKSMWDKCSPSTITSLSRRLVEEVLHQIPNP